MKRGPVLLGIIGIIVALVVATGIGWWAPWDSIRPPPPGDQPEVLFKTDVRLEEPWWASKPHIEWMRSEQVGQEMPAGAELKWFPWEGTLKLKITYPEGHLVTLSKKVKVEWNSGITVTFYWKTKQAGTHTLIAELYNKEGVLIDSRGESVTRSAPPR